MRSVALGGSEVRKSRSKFTDPTDGGNVCYNRDCSIAHILNKKRRLKAVFDVLDVIAQEWYLSLSVWSLEPNGIVSSPTVRLVPWSLKTLFSDPETVTSGSSRFTSLVFVF